MSNELESIFDNAGEVSNAESTRGGNFPSLDKVWDLGKPLLETMYPEFGTYQHLKEVEPLLRPVINAPMTGVGGLISLGRGDSLAEAAQGIHEGKTAGDYVAEAIPETPVMPGLNRLGAKGLGALTDMGVMTGAVEGAVGNTWNGPKLEVNMVPSEAAEAPSLPRPYDAETTIVEPKDLETVFDKAGPTPAEPTTLEEAFGSTPGNDASKMIHPAMEDEAFAEKGALEATKGDVLKPEPATAESGQVAIPGTEDLKNAQAWLDKTLSTSGDYSDVSDLKASRFGDIQANVFDDEQKIRAIEKDLTPEESHALIFAEKGQVPEAYRTDPKLKPVADLIEHPTPAMQEAMTKVRPWLDKAYSDLKLFYPDVHHVENYIPSLLDTEGANPSLSNKTGKFSTNNPFTNERVFDNVADAMDAGYPLKHNEIGDVLRTYSRYYRTSIANKQFVNLLEKMPSREGTPLVVKAEKAPMNYKPVPSFPGYKANPEIYQELKFMGGLEKGLPITRAAEIAQGVMKKAALSVSLFHHITLTEGAIGLGVNPLSVVASIPASMRAGGAAFLKPELTRDALKHGLTVGGVSEGETGLIKKVADGVQKAADFAVKKLMDKAAPEVKKILEPLAKVENAWDAGLWAHYHPMIKLWAYEHNVATMLAKHPNIPPDVVKRQVAQVINDAAGGQPWELLFNDPRWEVAMRRAFLANDWTTSNVKSFTNVFAKGVKGDLGRKYWFKQALLFLGATETMNYLNTKIQTGKGHFTWDNDPDKKADVWLFKGTDGRNHYLMVNKAFTEPFKWMTDPLNTVRHKLSPIMQVAVEQLTEHTMGGFDLDFARPGNRLKSLTDKVTPFSLGDNTFAGTFPTSSGMSLTKLKKGLETAEWERRQAMEKGDDKAANAALEDINKLMDTAQNNGIHATRVYRQIQQNIKSQLKYESRKDQQPSTTRQTFISLRDAMDQRLGELRNTIRKKSDAQ